MPNIKVSLIKKNTIYQGKLFKLIREKLKAKGNCFWRETVLHPGSVVIVPLLDNSKIVFVRQYRRAIGKYILELPAGTRSEKENPRNCAARELAEETGFKSKKLSLLGQFYSAPGISSEKMTFYLAEGLQYIGSNPEPNEILNPVIITMEAALDKIKKGHIKDAKSIIGLILTERITKSKTSKKLEGFRKPV
jgi:ADP-ribose pyrophosphatase